MSPGSPDVSLPDRPGAAAAPAITRRQWGLLFAASPGLAWGATPGVDAPPLPLPPRAVVLPELHESTLANGLTVVVVPRHHLPLVTAALLVRAGPEAELPGQSGVAAMTAALLTKGAMRDGRPRGATAIAGEAEALGASLDSASSWRSTTLSMTVTAPRLSQALALMSDALRHPLLARAELERARAQALDGLRVALGNPAEVGRMALRRAFWGDTPYGRVTSPAAIQRLTQGQVQAFHARQVRPGQTVLVLTGDVTPERAAELAQRHFGHWRSPAGTATLEVRGTAAPIESALLMVDMPGAGQSSVLVAAPFAAIGDADRRIGLVASAVLGGGYSARLNQEIRIRRGLSYGAFSEAESQSAGGMFTGRTQTHHATAAEVLQLMRDLVLRLADAPPGLDELAARQATVVGSFARRLDTTAGLAMLVLAQKAQGRPLADLGRHVTEILAVTPDQVRDFARRHWQPESLRAAIAGDLKAGGDALRALEAGAQRVTLAGLDFEQLGRRVVSTR